MQFVADKMLGRLARWLRAIGQDVAYGPQLSGAGLLRVARQQGPFSRATAPSPSGIRRRLS